MIENARKKLFKYIYKFSNSLITVINTNVQQKNILTWRMSRVYHMVETNLLLILIIIQKQLKEIVFYGASIKI